MTTLRAALAAIAMVFAACQQPASLPYAATLGTEEVAAALARGAPLGERDAAGRTALLVAAVYGDNETLKLLLARGASSGDRMPDGATALHLAARKACIACVRILAPALPDREAQAGPRHRTALHDAVLADDEKVVAALLDAGLDPDAKDSCGSTPLHLTLTPRLRRAGPIAMALLERGAQWHIEDGRGFTALHAAAAVDDVVLLRLVLARKDAASAIDDRGASGETALEVAERYQSDRAAEVLLAAGALPRLPPPLHEAARMDDLERAAGLVAFGADLSRRFAGKTALDVARERGSRRVLTLFTGR